MKKITPLFPDFHLPSLRRKARSAKQVIADKLAEIKSKSFDQLSGSFIRLIPAELLEQNTSGDHSRLRFFSKANTFWAFFTQVLDADSGCAEVIRKLNAYAAIKALDVSISLSTGSYCKARKKLDEQELEQIFKHTATVVATPTGTSASQQRRIIVVDGTGLSMPDTPENQAQWPQYNSQKEGCGFPAMKLCACFDLATGAILSVETGNKNKHELLLFREQYDTFSEGDIFLADKGFCSYFDINELQQRGVDSVISLARRSPVSTGEAIKKLGSDDLLIRWQKPRWNKNSGYSREDWEALPDELILRQIKVKIERDGLRPEDIYIVTTLSDPQEAPREEIVEIYLRRWEVELNFRDIKTTMGMDILRCKTPEMIRKELLMYCIAYNGIRYLIQEAARSEGQDPERISFKGTLQSLRNWEGGFNQKKLSLKEKKHLLEELYKAILKKKVPDRPGRREPRCIKRRPKPFPYLTRPRHEKVA